MKTKSSVLCIFVMLCSIGVLSQEQKKMVSIPEDQLTEQQKQSLNIQQVDTVADKAHGWVGIGKELGQAFDSALGSLTTRSNEFAGTKVGKFTMFIVAWKVMGDQAVALVNAIVHISIGMLELIVFLPIFLWSYRKSCMTRTICTGKKGPFWAREKTWEIKEYEHTSYEFTPRHAHCSVLATFTVIWVITVFSY